MPDHIDWDLLDRFFAGECTPAERADVVRWLETHPLPAKYVAALGQALGLGDRAAGGWQTDAAWVRLAETTRIAAEAAPPLRLMPRASQRRWTLAARSPLLRVAAVLALVTVPAALWWSATRPRPVTMREFTTARGQRGEMRLSDGTRIVLSVDSKVRIPGEYGTAARDVYLDGEAYFEVAHDSMKPFVVRAGNALVRDLGTRFGVRAYAGEQGVQVVVAEGKVDLRSATAGAAAGTGPAFLLPILVPGDVARLDPSGARTLTRGADVRRYLGWTEGRLTFEDTRLRDALPDLARWYDLDVNLATASLGERRLTLTVRGEALTQVLDGIALLVHARYERSGRSVTFYATEGGP